MFVKTYFATFFSSLAFGKTNDQITQFCMIHAEMMQIVEKPGGAARLQEDAFNTWKEQFRP